MLYIIGKLTLRGPGTKVYVRYNVFLNFAYVNGDADTDIEALPVSVNLRMSCIGCFP